MEWCEAGASPSTVMGPVRTRSESRPRSTHPSAGGASCPGAARAAGQAERFSRRPLGQRGEHGLVVADRLERHDRRMLSSRTITSLRIEPSRVRIVRLSTPVTQRQHVGRDATRGQAPGRHRHRDEQRRASLDRADPAEDVDVAQDLGPADLEDVRRAVVERPGRRPGSGRRRPRAMGCERVRAHRGTAMAGTFSTMLWIIFHDAPPWPMTMPARRVVTGTPSAAEQSLDLLTAAQVRGQVVVLVAEAAEVDDALAARPRRATRPKSARRERVALGEVAVVERRAPGSRRRRTPRMRARYSESASATSAAHRRPGAVVGLGVAGHGQHVVAGLDQGEDEPPADEAGCAGDEDARCMSPRNYPGPGGPSRGCGRVRRRAAAGYRAWDGPARHRSVQGGYLTMADIIELIYADHDWLRRHVLPARRRQDARGAGRDLGAARGPARHPRPGRGDGVLPGPAQEGRGRRPGGRDRGRHRGPQRDPRRRARGRPPRGRQRTSGSRRSARRDRRTASTSTRRSARPCRTSSRARR